MISPIFIIATGTIAWVVAIIIAIAVNASANVIWICITGAALGVVGIRYTFRRGRRGEL